MKKVVSIVKIGGDLIENKVALESFLTAFIQMKDVKILVHGGGKRASEMEQQLGIKTQIVGGRRITNRKSLEVATMVYAGVVNKNIVAKLQALGGNALGLSGADGNTIRANKRVVAEIDYGFAGDIARINLATIQQILKMNFIPVFCALTHDGKGQLLNTNADTVAAELAIALSAIYRTHLYYCFEKKGVLHHVNDNNSVITHLNQVRYEDLLKNKRVVEGMLPKLENAFRAVNHQVHKVCLGNISMLTESPEPFTTLTL